MRIEIRRGETIKNGTEMVGSHTKAKVVKNKVAPPFKTAEFDIMYGKGISKSGEIVDLAVEYDIIKKSGAWFSYGDRRLAQGRDNVKTLIETDRELGEELEAKVMAELKKRSSSYNDEAEAEAGHESAPVQTEADAADAPMTPAPKVKSRVNLDVDVDD